MLVNAGCEIAAVASGNKELARRVDISRPDVGKGPDTEMVARCHDVLAAATDMVVRSAIRADAVEVDRVEAED